MESKHPQIFLSTLWTFQWIFDLSALWGLSDRVSKLFSGLSWRISSAQLCSLGHNCERIREAREAERYDSISLESVWLWWSGERLSKRDCLHFSWGNRPRRLSLKESEGKRFGRIVRERNNSARRESREQTDRSPSAHRTKVLFWKLRCWTSHQNLCLAPHLQLHCLYLAKTQWKGT